MLIKINLGTKETPYGISSVVMKIKFHNKKTSPHFFLIFSFFHGSVIIDNDNNEMEPTML